MAKKGLEIGINFIIVVVLAVLILTLGTGFIQRLFAGVERIGTEVLDKAISDLKNNLARTDQKLGTTIGDKKLLSCGDPAEFAIVINNIEKNKACFSLDFLVAGDDQSPLGWIQSYIKARVIAPNSAKEFKIPIQAPINCARGDYVFLVDVGINKLVTDNEGCTKDIAFETYDDLQFIIRAE